MRRSTNMALFWLALFLLIHPPTRSACLTGSTAVWLEGRSYITEGCVGMPRPQGRRMRPRIDQQHEKRLTLGHGVRALLVTHGTANTVSH
ncbi:hypothetical protein QBC46DRAFT_375726 [Diplogelasinospora grovesii]|uniref:Secreted protein n=1 Tax=Diplogelasinospora grovesii TaxID=303347 RepID=A0AAN6S7G8_9PEZI|nr:hypothetical protein QBC46DRAFT_375726 [Diplogelasinospora grovesii]